MWAVVLYVVLALYVLFHVIFLPWYFSLFKKFPTIKLTQNPINFLLGHMIIVFRHYNLKISDIWSGKDFHEYYLRLAECFTRYNQKDGMAVLWMGVVPWTVFFSPETIEPILTSSKTVDKHFIYMLLNSWLGNGLVTSPKEIWIKHRKLLTSSFHVKILENAIPLLNEHANILIKKLKSISKSDPNSVVHDLRPLMQLVALDVICDQAMGIKLNAQNDPDTDFINAINRASEIFATRLFNPIFYPDFLFKFFPTGKQYFQDVNTLHRFTKKVIRDRKKKIYIQNLLLESQKSEINDSNFDQLLEPDVNNNKLISSMSKMSSADVLSRSRLSFLDKLLDEHEKNPTNITYQDINDEVHTFLFTGHESTTWAMTWAIFLLGLDARVQELAYQEILHVLDGRRIQDLNVDDYKKMDYVDAIFKETMRLYPLVPIIGRFLKEDFPFKVKGQEYFIPRFTSAIILPREVHRQPDHWPSPERFIPERFIPSSSDSDQIDKYAKFRPNNRHPFAYIPFSAGPRNCIGQKLAIIEGKVILARIIEQFKIVSLDERHQVAEKMEMTLRSIKPIRVQLIARDQQQQHF